MRYSARESPSEALQNCGAHQLSGKEIAFKQRTMLAAFGRSLSMDRGDEEQETNNLLHFDDDEQKESTTLTEAAAVALKDAKVREMLAAFRNEGPQALQRYVDDPACSDALDVLRGQSSGIVPGVVVPRPGEPVVEGSIVEPAAAVDDPRTRIAAEGLQKPQVREMLEAFRREGPAALQRFAGDPECASVVARLRGVAPPPPPKKRPPTTRRPRILLGATGSVATVKVPKLAVQLKAFADVRVVATERGRFFLGKARTYDGAAYGAFEQAQIEVLSDDDEWARWNQVGDPVLHVDLREWADLLLIAPLGANTLAKLANSCVEIKILRRVRAESLIESSRRPPRHRRDACSMAWRCRFPAARRSEHGRVNAESTRHTG